MSASMFGLVGDHFHIAGEPDEYVGLSWALDPTVVEDQCSVRDNYFDWGWFDGN